MHPGEKYIAYFLTILAGISLGAIPIISAIMRDNNFFSLEQMMLRLLFGALFSTIILLYFSVRKNQNQVWLDKNIQLGYFIQGIVLVFQFYVYLGAIVIGTPAGEVALLVQIHAIVTLLIGWLFLNELLTKEKSLAVLLAIMGIVILAQPWNWNTVFNYWLGDLMALSNGFLYGIYIILGRKFNSIRKNVPATISISWVLI